MGSERLHLCQWNNRRAADVVAVQAIAGIAVALRIAAIAEHDAGFRTRYRRLRIAEFPDANGSAELGPEADIALLHNGPRARSESTARCSVLNRATWIVERTILRLAPTRFTHRKNRLGDKDLDDPR